MLEKNIFWISWWLMTDISTRLCKYILVKVWLMLVKIKGSKNKKKKNSIWILTGSLLNQSQARCMSIHHPDLHGLTCFFFLHWSLAVDVNCDLRYRTVQYHNSTIRRMAGLITWFKIFQQYCEETRPIRSLIWPFSGRSCDPLKTAYQSAQNNIAQYGLCWSCIDHWSKMV